MDLGLSGKKALITGATKGIGRAIAERLVQEGASIAICARNEQEVSKAVADLQSLASQGDAGAKVIGAVVDVADKAGYQQWITAAADELGGVDIFIPNVSAGGGDSEENWRSNFEIDMLGAVRGVEAVAPYLNDAQDGAIVFISTTAAIENFLAPQPYNAIKAALINYAKHLSQSMASQGIRVNTVSPGPVFIEGGVWDDVKKAMPDLYESTVAQIPIGRMGRADEIANAVVFLASPAASLITGTNLIADGGFTKGIQY